jgi:hypothetical protein
MRTAAMVAAGVILAVGMFVLFLARVKNEPAAAMASEVAEEPETEAAVPASRAGPREMPGPEEAAEKERDKPDCRALESALAASTQREKKLTGELERCRLELHETSKRDFPSLERCLKYREVAEIAARAEHLEQRLAETRDCEVQSSHASARRATLDSFFGETLKLTQEQVAHLSEEACALRELRWSGVAGLHDDDLASEQISAHIRTERQSILDDIERFLGKEPYAEFRRLGGIGLLNDVLECADRDIR